MHLSSTTVTSRIVCLTTVLGIALPGVARPSEPMTFSGDAAMNVLVELTDAGHRYPGAPKRAEAIERQAKLLRDAGALVSLQPFKAASPIDNRTYSFNNIIAEFFPERRRRVLLGTHFDTRSVGDLDEDPALRMIPIPGANDGTSGVAVLIELARALPAILKGKTWGVDIVLFDAEDLGTKRHLDGFSLGAKYFAKTLSKRAVENYVAAIVVDMVGERDLILKREAYSMQRAAALTDTIWKYGRARAPSTFSRARGGGIIDDHLPLLEVGIPSTLLIDLDYPQWHTASDLAVNCSPKSLDIVGDTLEAYLRGLRL